MTAQPALFDVSAPLARRSDPETSRVAAKSIGRGAEQAIMDAFAVRDGWTASELEQRLNRMHGPTVVSALARLGKAGVVTDSGARRRSARGRLQIVWVLHWGAVTV